MPYLQSLVKNEDQITLSPSPNNGVRVFSSPANGNLDMGQYNIVNAGSIALGGPGLDEATVFFTNNSGTYPLQADGNDLYFDGQLIAKASDIQTIDQWALYAAASNVDMDNRNVENVANIRFDGQGATNLNIISGRLNYGGVPVASQWAAYPAANDVDMDTRSLSNVGAILQNPGGVANLQTIGVAGNINQDAGQLATLPAIQTSTIGTVAGGAASNLSFSNTDSVAGFQYKFNGGNVAVDTVQTLTGSRPNMLNGVGINLGPSGTYGALTTDAAGTVLSWNGQAITAGGGGNAATWSLYPAINNTILPNPGIPTVPLTIGTRASGASVNIEANQNVALNADNAVVLTAGASDITGNSTYTMTDIFHTMLMDRGASIAGQGTITINAKNGTGGRINIYADSSSSIAPAGGGLVDITAYSSVGSVSPLALSRVNVEAATITIAAGALGTLAFVPGSVNLLSGLGTGVQILTTVGPINIAGGTSATVAGGLGVYFDGASSGVNVAGGQTLFVDKIFPRTIPIPGKVQIPLLDIASPNATIGFAYNPTSVIADVNPNLVLTSVKPAAIIDATNATGTNGQVLTAGAGGSVVWASPSSSGGGATFYLDATGGAAPQTGTINGTANTGAQTTITKVGNGINSFLTATFITPVGFITQLGIPAGFWDLNLYANSSTGSGISFYASLFQVDADGVSNPVSIYTGTVLSSTAITGDSLYTYSFYVPNFTLTNSTKRLSLVLYTNYTSGNKTFTAEFRNGTISHLHTTILTPPPAVKQATYYNSVAQNLTSGNTDISFDSTGAWNNDGGYITHTNGTTAFTVVQAGLYQLEFNAVVLVNSGSWTLTNNKTIGIDITRSPTAEQAIIQTGGIQGVQNYAQSVISTYYLNAGDIINLRIGNVFTGTPVPQAQGLQNTFDLNTFFAWTFVST